MGYTTGFQGAFVVTPTLKPEHKEFLTAFRNTRRMKRNAEIAETFPDPIRIAAGLPIGQDGGNYVGSNSENRGQDHDTSIVDYNIPPGIPVRDEDDFTARMELETAIRAKGAQPSLWCQWLPSDDGDEIVWDEAGKFYYYVEWICYLINNYLKPWGYSLNGVVSWDGEEQGDVGQIVITDNEVEVKDGIAEMLDVPNKERMLERLKDTCNGLLGMAEILLNEYGHLLAREYMAHGETLVREAKNLLAEDQRTI